MTVRRTVQWVSLTASRRFAQGVRRALARMHSPAHLDVGASADLVWIDGGDAPFRAIAALATPRAVVTSESAETCERLAARSVVRAVCYAGPASALPDGVVDLGASSRASDADEGREHHAEERFAKILGRMATLPEWRPRTPVGWPLHAMVEIVRACNLRCPLCPVGNGAAEHYQNMTVARFREVAAALAETVAWLSLYNYGEPLLHPDIAELIAIAKHEGDHVALTTNGTILRNGLEDALVAAGLDAIRISIDGTTQEVYEKYRVGGSLAEVWTNVARLAAAKRHAGSATPSIEAQFIVNRYNEHQTADFQRLAIEAGADDVRLKTFNALMSGPELAEAGREFLPADGRYSRYAEYDRLQYRDRYRLAHCEWPRIRTVINADGAVVPCCYDFNGRHRLGSFGRAGEPWWDTEARAAFRDRLRSDPMSIDICSVCPVGIPSLDVAVD